MDYGLEIRKISSDLRVNSIPKFFGKKVKKGVDKGGGVWYYIQALAREARRKPSEAREDVKKTIRRNEK